MFLAEVYWEKLRNQLENLYSTNVNRIIDIFTHIFYFYTLKKKSTINQK